MSMVVFSPEDEGSMFLRNVCMRLQVHTAHNTRDDHGRELTAVRTSDHIYQAYNKVTHLDVTLRISS
jgi:hypothetical protein